MSETKRKRAAPAEMQARLNEPFGGFKHYEIQVSGRDADKHNKHRYFCDASKTALDLRDTFRKTVFVWAVDTDGQLRLARTVEAQ